jgi:hypothetical protein
MNSYQTTLFFLDLKEIVFVVEHLDKIIIEKQLSQPFHKLGFKEIF